MKHLDQEMKWIRSVARRTWHTRDQSLTYFFLAGINATQNSRSSYWPLGRISTFIYKRRMFVNPQSTLDIASFYIILNKTTLIYKTLYLMNANCIEIIVIFSASNQFPEVDYFIRFRLVKFISRFTSIKTIDR